MTEELDLRPWVMPFYLHFWNGTFAASAEWIAKDNLTWLPLLERTLEAIEPDIVEDLLRDRHWQAILTGAYFCGLKNWREFELTVGRTLVACQLETAPQGLCFALARFESHYGSHCIRGYLNNVLRNHFGEVNWAIGAIAWLDKRLNTSHTEDYLVPLALHASQCERELALRDYRNTFDSNTLWASDPMHLTRLEKQIDAPLVIGNYDDAIARFAHLMHFCDARFPCVK